MKSTALFTTVTMAHMALCVPVPWMAGDKILPLMNKDAPNSATSGRSPKTDNTFALASSHLAPGPILQKAEQSFNSLWDNWKKKHGSRPALNVDDAKKDIPVLIITEMGELGVGIPSSSQPSLKQASNPKQKVVSVPPGNEKADNVSVTEMGELSIGIPSPVPSPPPSSSPSSLPSSSRPSNGTSPCQFYVGKPRDHDDVLIIFLVSTFLLVVVVVEAWGPVCRSVRNRFSSRRKGAIRLVEETETKPKSFRNDSVLVKSESG